MVPPFSRYAVVPVARKVWLQISSGRPMAYARRLIMSSALGASIGIGPTSSKEVQGS